MMAFQPYMLLIFLPLAFMSLMAGSHVNESEQFLKDVQERKARDSET